MGIVVTGVTTLQLASFVVGAWCTVPLLFYNMHPCGFERSIDAVAGLQIHLLCRPLGYQSNQSEAAIQFHTGQWPKEYDTGYLAIECIPGAG
jgi:hypothetical protein